MEQINASLFDHTLIHLEVVDRVNHKFCGKELTRENIMTTKIGTRVVSVTPLLSRERYSDRTERLVTVKSELGDNIKMRKVTTVEELALILKGELGMKLMFDSKII